MKKLLLILLCLPFIGFGQTVPQGINYQAVARDANGDVLMNQALTIQFSVISDITTSAVSWQETHQDTTNDYGLFTAIIGQGISTSVGSSAVFDSIDWGASNHFLKVEVDYGGGLEDMGTTAFMSVPYALYAKNISFGGFDYTSTANPIFYPMIGGLNPMDRFIINTDAGSNNFNNYVANSGSVLTTKGGIKILPLSTGTGVSQPSWGGSLFLGEWGWGSYPLGNGPSLSQRTNDKFRPGSGNVYANSVRQNIVFSNLYTQGPNWSAGYQGAALNSMYYNQGDIRYIVIDPTNGYGYATVTLPAISEPMLGQVITVVRTNVPNTFANYDAAVFIRANTADKINCPNSIFVDDNNQGGVALDPYNLIGNSGASFGLAVPSPYKGDEIMSATFVASQNGYFNANLNGTSIGGAITTQFVWQFISSGSPGL